MILRLIPGLALHLSILLGTVVPITTAHAADLKTSLRSKQFDLCVRVASVNTGAPLLRSHCGDTNASFVIVDAADGAKSIRPGGDAGLCLDATAGAVKLAACSQSPAQKFSVNKNKDGGYAFRIGNACLTTASNWSTNLLSAQTCVVDLPAQSFAVAKDLLATVVPAPTPSPAPTPAPTPTPAPSPAPTPTPSPVGIAQRQFSSGNLTLTAGQSVVLGGFTLAFSKTANLSVLRADGAIVWETKTAGSCASTNCRLVFQNDGNLVIYADQAVLWSSGTYNNNMGVLTFANQAPYLTVANSNLGILWSTSPVPVVDSTVAKSAAAFVRSMGINTHLDQYERPATVIAKLNYLGITLVRDHYNDQIRPALQQLANAGKRLDMIDYKTDIASLVDHARICRAMAPDFLNSIEGLNEINNFPFSYQGSVWAGGWPNNNGPAAAAFQTAFYAAIKTDPALSGLKVFNLTAGNSANNAAALGLLSNQNMADFGNIHPYAPNGVQPFAYMLRELRQVYTSVAPAQTVITETGYSTSVVSERAQAILLLNTYLAAFANGFHETFIYLMTDNPWEHFGIYDGADRPKMAAIAIHNLTELLADPGPPTAAIGGSLGFELTGLPAGTGHQLLLQKRSGAFQLIVWNEVPIAKGTADLPVIPVKLSLRLKISASSVRLFDPVAGAQPLVQKQGVNAIEFSLGVQPLVIDIQP